MKDFSLLAAAVTLCGAILPFSAAFQLNAQTNDWANLQRIAPGSAVSVKTFNHRGTRQCELLQTTASDLVCEWQRGVLERRLKFPRDEVREVRLERPEHHRMILGAIVGGAVGGAIGAVMTARSSDPETRRIGPVTFVVIGTALGAGVGRAIHEHGPVLYQRK